MELLTYTLRRTLRMRLSLRRDAPLVVAVSGGADSVALLAALADEGYPCVAAHCNFHLRGDESMRDMRFVESLTEKLGIDLYVKDFNVPAAMAETGESVEMACRRLRYDWFDELLNTLGGADVAVGHHREDNVETFFLNLARGTGIAGLTGMSYRRGSVVRPLLDCTRAQIEAYLAGRGLDYVTDSTNAEDDYMRNRLRNRLLPYFNNLMPGALEGVERTMAMLTEAKSIYDKAVELAAERYGSVDSGSIDVGRMAESDTNAATLLFELLRPAGFTRTQSDNVLVDPMRSGVAFEAPAGCSRAELSRGVLTIVRGIDGVDDREYEITLDEDITEPLHIAVTRHESAAAFVPDKSQRVLCLDESVLDGSPRLCLRHWCRGDRIRPFGMSGSRLVSDLFSDAKMTAAQKRDTWLLTRDDRILWVLGVRTSAHFPVGKRTKGYIELRIK